MPASLLRLGGWRSVGALVLVAAVVTGIGQTGAGHSVLQRAGLIEQPAPYTALMFSRPEKPVSRQALGRRTRFTLTFRIQNAETRTRTYVWSLLVVQRPGQARTIRSHTVRVGPGQAASIPEHPTITCEQDSVEFIVQLDGMHHEAIHARTTCPRPAPRRRR
ncbi:MAG: hypothetical protein ACLPKI_02510 [Streptosporangiaceae bacterium]